MELVENFDASVVHQKKKPGDNKSGRRQLISEENATAVHPIADGMFQSDLKLVH